MSRTRRFISGASIGYAHQFAVILVGLWMTPFLLHQVGQRSLGLWLVAGQILGYISLLDLGVLAILPREVAHASGLADSLAEGGLVARLVWQVQRIVRLQTIGLALLSATIVWLLPNEWLDLRWPLAFVFVSFVALYPLRVASALLQGLQELGFLSKAAFAGWALGAAVSIVLALNGLRLHALTVGWAVGAGVPAIAAWRYARVRWPQTLTFRGEARGGDYFKRSMWVSVAQVAQVLLNGSDILLLGRLLGPAAVVPYTCTSKLVTVFANQPQMVMHAAQPALSELRASGSKERLFPVATALTQAMLMMSGAVAAVVVAANHYFVSWWVGPDQYGGWPLTVALIVMMLLRHWNVATNYTLFCFGYERQLSLTGLADGLLSALGTAALVWKWGPIGAPLASIASVLIVGLPLNLRSVAGEMGLTPAQFIASLGPLMIRTTPIVALAAVGGSWVSDRSFVQTAVLTAATAAVYAAAVIPLAWNGPVGPYLRLMWPALIRIGAALSSEGPSLGMRDRWRLARGKAQS